MGFRDVQRLINIGVHIGDIHTDKAICVTEVSQIDTGKTKGEATSLGHHDEYGVWHGPQGIEKVMATIYTVRFMDKIPHSASYPDIAAYLANVLSDKPLEGRKAHMLVNISDVGNPAWKDMKKEIERIVQGVQLSPIKFVSGENYNRSLGTLGKSFLVSRVQSLIQNSYLRGPGIPNMEATCNELLVYNEGDEGSIKERPIALALSCLEDPHSLQVRYSDRVF